MTREAGTQNQIIPYVRRCREWARRSKVAWKVGETVDAYLEDIVHDKVATEYDNEECHMHPPKKGKLTPKVVFLEGCDEAHEA